MELIIFVGILFFVAAASLIGGADTRPDERDHVRNW
jgi:hypothetical protein